MLNIVRVLNVITQFFGFRNPFVQRLLRELVVNVNGSSEQSLPSASFCIRPSAVENITRPSVSFAYPDLQPDMEKPQTTRKRSRKQKDINMKSVSASAHKRFRPQKLINNSVASSSSERNHNGKYSVISSALMMNTSVVSIQLSRNL